MFFFSLKTKYRNSFFINACIYLGEIDRNKLNGSQNILSKKYTHIIYTIANDL